MNRNEAIAYLTRCADDNGDHWYQGRVWSDVETCPTCHGSNEAGWLHTPCSRYGRTSADVAPIAYRHALWFSRQSGYELTRDSLDSSMSLAVNDHPDVETGLQGYAAELAGANVDAMVEGYLSCQLWAQPDFGHPNDGNLDANYSCDDIAEEYVDSVRGELAALVAGHPLAVRMYLKHLNVTGRYRDPQAASGNFGHDFYLTREGHGAGFWDRGLGDLGDYLTKISKWAGAAADLDDRGDGVLR